MLHALFPPLADQVIFPKEPRTFEGLHGVFADSLPDAWGRELLRRRAQMERVDFNSLSALDRLALIGSSGPGALTYRPQFTEFDASDIDLDVLSENALAILEGRDTKVLDELVRLGGSSGGARPKIVVAMNDRGELQPLKPSLPAGFDAWIIKFRSPQDPQDAGPLEAAYADMARAAGLQVSETRLISSRTGPGYFATKRFDRSPGGGRSHMVSAAAMLETDWAFPGSYEILLKLTRRVTRDQKAVEALYRRAVFNCIAQNRDDHWKQHAFLMDSVGKWTAAPSFDITFSPGPGGEHYLTIGGRSKDAEMATFLEVAAAESIDLRVARSIIEEVTSAVAQFSQFARTYDVSASSKRQMKALAPKLPQPPRLKDKNAKRRS